MSIRTGLSKAVVIACVTALGACSGCGSQVGIEALPSELFVEVGGTTTVNVVAVMSVGGPRPVTSELTVTTSDATVADVAGQEITGVAEGSAVLTITDGTFTTIASVTVVPPGSIPAGLVVAPTEITCTPDSDPIHLEVFAVFSSGSSEDITDTATFGSSNSTIAVVTMEGVVVCVSPGTATVRAGYLGRSASTAVTVGALPPTSVTVIPASVICAVGEDTASVQVLAVEADGTTTDASQTAGYTSSDSSVATASGGQIDCVAVGTATITANVSGVLGTVGVEVRTAVGGPDEVVALSFTSQSLTCTVTATPNFVLQAELGDGSTQDVTNGHGVVYQSSDGNVVLILNNEPVCVQQGNATLTATYAGLQASVDVTVQ